MNGSTRRGLAAPYALVTGYAALLAIGTVAAALHGRFPATGVLIAAAAVVTAWSFAAEPLAVIPLAVVGWLTAVGFSHPPYAQLRVTGPQAGNAAVVMGGCALAGGALGLLMRWLANRPILESVGAGSDAGQPATGPGQVGKGPEQLTGGQPAAGYGALMVKAAYAVGARRALLGVLLAAIGLPLLTALLVLARIGTANVIELGTARAMGEVEALEALGIDPVHYLVVPRVMGMALGVFALTVYLILGAVLSGYLWAFLQNVPLRPRQYFHQLAGALDGLDFALLALKTLAFGFTIALVTCYHGLAQRLRLEEVSHATVTAVAQSVIACVLIDSLFILIYLVT